MYGLPSQTLTDVQQSLDWARALGSNIQVQCMQTLLLPGTPLRDTANNWGIIYEEHPPYSVHQTAHLSPDDIATIEMHLHEHPDLPADPVTPRFCGQRLRGLFRAQHHIRLEQLTDSIPGSSNRRALLFHGQNYFAHRSALGTFIDRAISTEPDVLWQFVLLLEQEEPLDLLDELIARIKVHPSHLLDRFASASAFDHMVSRRLYIRIGKEIEPSWQEAVEDLLRGAFG